MNLRLIKLLPWLTGEEVIYFIYVVGFIRKQIRTGPVVNDRTRAIRNVFTFMDGANVILATVALNPGRDKGHYLRSLFGGCVYFGPPVLEPDPFLLRDFFTRV